MQIHLTPASAFLFLPAFIIRRFKSRNTKKHYTSDFSMTNGFMNKALHKLSGVEHAFVHHGFIPFGTSIICVAQKDEQ